MSPLNGSWNYALASVSSYETSDNLITLATKHTERTRVNQHVLTSLWEGRHNNIMFYFTLILVFFPVSTLQTSSPASKYETMNQCWGKAGPALLVWTNSTDTQCGVWKWGTEISKKRACMRCIFQNKLSYPRARSLRYALAWAWPREDDEMWRSYYTGSFQLIFNLFISVDKPTFYEDRLTLLRKSDQQEVHFIANYLLSQH